MTIKTKLTLTFSFATLAACEANAQNVPTLINYQGRLTGEAGTPLPTANYAIQFRLWDSPSNTAPDGLIWGQQQNVFVQANGVLNVILGAPGGSAIPGAVTNDLAFAFSSSNRFLGVTVVSSNGVPLPTPVEIVPRQQLLSVPFALMTAQVAPAAITLTNLAPREVGTNVGVGGMATSLPIASQSFAKADGEVEITNLVATLRTTGRPVFISLVPALADTNAPPQTGASGLEIGGVTPAGGLAYINWSIYDGQTLVWRFQQYINNPDAPSQSRFAYNWPPSAISGIVALPAGLHTFHLRGWIPSNDSASGSVFNVRLFAYEL